MNKKTAAETAAAAPEAPQVPERIAIGKVDGAIVDENGFYVGEETKREIVRRYNTAAKLAEALRDCIEAINDELGACGRSEINEHPVLKRHERFARKGEAALAEWRQGNE
jgi:hypothetical protein